MQMQMRVEATSNCQLPHDSSSRCSCRSDRERERNCSILFCTVRFAYEVLSVVMIEILATVLCVRSSNSSFLYPRPQPLGSSLCMSLSPGDSYVNQQPDNRWQLNSTRLSTQLWTRLIVGDEAGARCVALFARTLLDNSLKSGARTAATATVHCCCPSPTSLPLIYLCSYALRQLHALLFITERHAHVVVCLEPSLLCM